MQRVSVLAICLIAAMTMPARAQLANDPIELLARTAPTAQQDECRGRMPRRRKRSA